MKLKKINLLIYLCIGFLLTACGFAPRSAENVPPPMRTLHFESTNPYSPLSTQLQRTFRSVDIHLVDDPNAAPVTFRIISSQWTYDIPSILYSGEAVTYSYILTVVYALQTSKGGNIYGPKTIKVKRSLIQNVNQIYTPDATMFMKREITRTMAILIYNNLMSSDVRHALQKSVNN